MIIGISGKKQSGKDTVANIWNYLIFKTKERSVLGYDPKIDYSKYVDAFENKKFAFNIKRIIAIMTGYTVESLENEDVKNIVLPEIWWFYRVYDKSTKTYKHIAYAKNKDAYSIDCLVKPTIRFMLTYIGTDLLRNMFHEDVHVNMLMSEYYADRMWSMQNVSSKKWIISDVRFKNELDAIKCADKNITIRVNKPLIELCNQWLDNTKCAKLKNKDLSDDEKITEFLKQSHESETALDNAEFDYVIDNNGTLEDLVEKVKVIMIENNII